MVFLLNLGIVFAALFTISSYGKYTYNTKYIDVPVDHFSRTNNRTFPMRYLINDTFWEAKDGPIFFYTGSEVNVEEFAQNTDFLWKGAEKLNALIVFAEHRYHSASIPFKKSSKNDIEDFSYLSSPQALADFVDLLYDLKNHQTTNPLKVGYSGERSNPVIAFGSSYGGLLAAWLRMKYPAVVEGALASSAPFLLFSGTIPCESFNRALTEIFNDTSSMCGENLKKFWQILRKTLSQESGQQWINENWKLCKPIKNESDMNRMLRMIASAHSSVGMVNYRYSSDLLAPSPANPVEKICNHLNKSLTDEQLLSTLYDVISTYFNYTGKSNCLEWSADPFSTVGMDRWGFQACTEIVIPFCRNGTTDMFEPAPWNFTMVSQACYKMYGVTSNENYIKKQFGLSDLSSTSNIIFSNELLDPWYPAGVTQNVSSSTVVVPIPNSAEYFHFGATHPADSPSVTEVREFYFNIFRKWIGNYRKKTARSVTIHL